MPRHSPYTLSSLTTTFAPDTHGLFETYSIVKEREEFGDFVILQLVKFNSPNRQITKSYF